MNKPMDRNLAFFCLKRKLGRTNEELAKDLGRPYKTVEGWSGGVAGKSPPQTAIDQMVELLRRKCHSDLAWIDKEFGQ